MHPPSSTDLSALFDPQSFKLGQAMGEDMNPSSGYSFKPSSDDVLSGGNSRKTKRPSRRSRSKTMMGEKSVRLGNNGRRLVRSAIAKALLEKPELREKCRRVATVKSATVKQLLRMCEIVGVREVAEEAIRAMDPSIDLEDPKLWAQVHEDDSPENRDVLTTNTFPLMANAPHKTVGLAVSGQSRSGFPDLVSMANNRVEDQRSRQKLGDTIADMHSMLGELAGHSRVESTPQDSDLNIFDNPLLHNKLQQQQQQQPQPQFPLFTSFLEGSGMDGSTSTSTSFSSGLPSWLSSPVSLSVSDPRRFSGFRLGEDTTPTSSSLSLALMLHSNEGPVVNVSPPH
ncbi:hypothetical protein FOZ63_021030 [Perkinsus olseni]|uniref:Uncharacterized protein n=1 Tax=Perkinsus olseni TaxID=32597 RepID=A0A7J6RK05_PEROL|nr:hypothetical protein FOZ63_021030 [Perkinsus olseni]